MEYIWKALEKGYLEHPGPACCTDDMFERFFVNRQLPCLNTNSRHVLLLPPMHQKSLWCAKERALGVQTG